jgi:uncharacterized membrane protein
VVTGILTSKIISVILIVMTIAFLYLAWYLYLFDKVTLLYISVAVVMPLIFVIFTVFRSTDRKQMHQASRMMKIVMLLGILYSVVVKILITWNLF